MSGYQVSTPILLIGEYPEAGNSKNSKNDQIKAHTKIWLGGNYSKDRSNFTGLYAKVNQSIGTATLVRKSGGRVDAAMVRIIDAPLYKIANNSLPVDQGMDIYVRVNHATVLGAFSSTPSSRHLFSSSAKSKLPTVLNLNLKNCICL